MPLEERFFRSLLLPAGCFKTTARNRLGDLDRLIIEAAPAAELMRVLDVGVSSGVTTLELLEALERAGRRVRAVACDLSIRGRLIRLAPGFDALLDTQGRLLQLSAPGFVRSRAWASASLKGRLLSGLFQLLESFLKNRAGSDVALVTRELSRRDDVELVEQDVLVERPDWGGAFHIIRAANLLNRSYFDETALTRAAALLASYLAPDGLLAICRTHEEDGRNHATIFRKRGEGLIVEARLGQGSEVEDLAVAATTNQVAAPGVGSTPLEAP